VPVELDHSEIGEASLRAADRLIDEGGVITLLHVVAEIPGYAAAYLPEDTLQKRRDEAHALLEKMAAGAGVKAKVVVLTSPRPSIAILEATAGGKADCIIIASHHPGIQDYFLGSTAARVVRHAECSVLVRR
jgi:nucleotide-binding universal stress UspA family protein